MSFTFPDPNITPEFTAANGITYAWDVEDNKWQIRGFKAPGGRVAIFSPTEPLKHPDFNPPDDELIAGDTWYDNSDPDQLKEYVYDGTHWVGTGNYVKKKGGDSMQGPLNVSGQRSPNADGVESTVKALNIDSGQNSSLQLKHNGNTRVYVGDSEFTLIPNLKFNAGGKSIFAGSDKKGFTINTSGVFYEGVYTADKHVATKKNVEESIYLDPLDPDSNIYVKRAGDTITGDLKIKGNAQIQFIDPPGSGTLMRASRVDGEYPLIFDLRHPGGQVAGGYDIKVQGNSAYNALRFTNAKGTAFEVNGGGGAIVGSTFKMDVSLDDNKITKLGNAVADKDAVPYAQVKKEIREFGINNESSIISTRDGLNDLIAAEVLLATEDENYLQTNLMEHAVPCWPADNHPLYHLIPQDYMLMTRMFEGSKKTEDAGGNVISDNKTLDCDFYGNDQLSNLMIIHIPTGKIQDISIKVSHEGNSWNAAGTSLVPNKKPALRGHTVIPRDNGDVDVYSWIHNPRRNPKSQPGPGQPLVRIHIPAGADPSNPFAGVTTQHTNIFCDPALLTTPDQNPYDIYDKNTSKDLKYQYEISQVAWNVIDSATGKRHHFLMSYNKGSRDYVTQRVFQINFDDLDPDEGTITPVGAHASSTHGDYTAGWHVIKKDTNDIFRCFLYGSPTGLTELYFKGDLYNRQAELRNYGDYIPLGDRVVDPDGAVNGIGKPLIVGKGIIDNWYKSTTLAPQFLTYAPIDNDDYFSNIIVWYQSAYGVCTLNIQDLGTIDRSDEVHLENNYQGSEAELSSMMIETKATYDSYLQDSSSRNLMRFNTIQPDTHSHGCLYFFDYKADYKYDSNNDGSITNYGEEKTLYNSTRTGTDGNSGKNQDQILFKRPILEVKPNYKTGKVEVHAIVIGFKHHPTQAEPGYHETFNGESITKFGDVFICAGAAKSHSSVTEPRVYLFDPQARQIQRVSNTEVNSTSLIPCPDHGLVIGAAYGTDSQDNGTPVYMTSMLSIQKVVENRDHARVLRKLCEITGEDPSTVKGTWALTANQTVNAPPSSGEIDYGNDWDEQD